MNNGNSFLLPCLTAVLLFSPAAPAMAADTTEPFDIGASDVDMYMGYDGIGLRRDERAINGEIMLGYGVNENLSAFIGSALSGDESLASESARLYFGVFSTLLDSDHLDLDLAANVASDNADASRLGVTPSLEFNIDRDPELKKWGFYLRAGLPVFSQESGTLPEAEPTNGSEPAGSEVAVQVESTTGVYYTLFAGNQLLLEYDMGFLPNPGDDERSVQVGALALGYNVAISDALELINHVSVDIPQPGETASVGFLTGFIATVPAAPSPVAPSDRIAAGKKRSPQPGRAGTESRRTDL